MEKSTYVFLFTRYAENTYVLIFPATYLEFCIITNFMYPQI